MFCGTPYIIYIKLVYHYCNSSCMGYTNTIKQNNYFLQFTLFLIVCKVQLFPIYDAQPFSYTTEMNFEIIFFGRPGGRGEELKIGNLSYTKLPPFVDNF